MEGSGQGDGKVPAAHAPLPHWLLASVLAVVNTDCNITRDRAAGATSHQRTTEATYHLLAKQHHWQDWPETGCRSGRTTHLPVRALSITTLTYRADQNSSLTFIHGELQRITPGNVHSATTMPPPSPKHLQRERWDLGHAGLQGMSHPRTSQRHCGRVRTNPPKVPGRVYQHSLMRCTQTVHRQCTGDCESAHQHGARTLQTV